MTTYDIDEENHVITVCDDDEPEPDTTEEIRAELASLRERIERLERASQWGEWAAREKRKDGERP
jgi:hypothetical protein